MKTLEIGGIDSRALASACGTPLLVYDEEKIEAQLAVATDNFQSTCFVTEVVYAAKAFSCKAMFQKVKEAGVNMSKIYFHGNNKTTRELNMALKTGCGTIVLDNLLECEKLIALSKNHRKPVRVLLRVNPGIEAHTHEYIMTANMDWKFGILIHIKTKNFSIGGGSGINHIAEDKPIPLEEMAGKLVDICERLPVKKEMTLTKLLIEPGRAIAGEAGYSLYTMGHSKDTDNRHYVFVDGGMSDNIRPVLKRETDQDQLRFEADEELAL